MHIPTRSILDSAVLGWAGGFCFISAIAVSAQVAPERVVAYPLSADALEVTWMAGDSGATAYRVERRLGWEGAWEVLAESLSPDATSFQDGGLAPATEVFYRVSALGSGGAAMGDLARARTDDRPNGSRTIAFRTGLNGYAGTFDIGINQLNPTLTRTGTILVVDNNSATDEWQVLTRFDHIVGSAPEQLPEGAQVERALLRLALGNGNAVESRGRMFFHRMLIPWDGTTAWGSSSLGWNGVQQNGFEAEEEPAGVHFFPRKNEVYEVDITPAVQAWARGEPNFGWLIRTRLADAYGYTSFRVDALDQRPELEITYDLEPGNRAPEVTKTRQAGDVRPEPAPLDLRATDADLDALQVTFYGRRRAQADDDFTFALLPDTQFYTAQKTGGQPAMMTSQISWIIANRAAHNIAFVLHVGDITDHGDQFEVQWIRGSHQGMYLLEDPITTGLPEGIPYVVSVGNHDQTPNGDPQNGTTHFYNQYFGVDHFRSKSYYGDNYGNDNNNHYSLLTVGSIDFLVVSLEAYRPRYDTDLLAWASQVVGAFPERKAIIIVHYTMNPGLQGDFSVDGQATYDALKHHPSLFMIVGGHVTGEGYRVDEYEGNRVYSFVQNYQSDGNGGDGYFGLFTLSPRNNEIRVKTYSPWLDRWRTWYLSDFTVPYDFGTEVAPFVELARYEVAAGEQLRHAWDQLQADTEYEWYVEVTDGQKTVRSEPRHFRVAPATYSQWRELHFDADDPLGAPDADADGDGVSNRMEFGLGTDPRNPGDGPGRMVAVPGAQLGLTIRYERRSNTGLDWVHEVSGDLREWTPVDADSPTARIQVAALEDERESVELTIESPEPSLFWRLVLP